MFTTKLRGEIMQIIDTKKAIKYLIFLKENWGQK